MNSFIIISKTTQQQQKYLDEFIQTHHISAFDKTLIEEDGSVGIEIIRKLQETLYLKPYKGNEKMIIIHHAERLTTEAQNAFLKVLEEPPTFVYLFLLATTEEAFLPTILSRCTLIKFTQESKEELDTEALTKDVAILTTGSVGEKLALAEQRASEKEHLAQWMKDTTRFVREQMMKAIDDKEKTYIYTRMLLQLQEGNKIISTTNVNPRIILEHIFLTIEQ